MKTFSFRRSLRGSTVVLYLIILWGCFIVARLLNTNIHHWVGVVVSILNVALINAIDKQLPTRRWKNLTFCLLIMGITFTSFMVRGFVLGRLPSGVDEWIVGALMLISYGYGFYCLWRWRRSTLSYKDVVMMRELRARRRRKLSVSR